MHLFQVQLTAMSAPVARASDRLAADGGACTESPAAGYAAQPEGLSSPQPAISSLPLPNGGSGYHLLEDSEDDDQQSRALEQVFGQASRYSLAKC